MNHDPDSLDSSAVADPLYNVNLTADELSRFWEKVDVGDPESCWPWNASLTKYGYGRIKIRKRRPGGHRVSYLIHYGPFNLALQVCHKCDNRKCVNPKHLFLGTQLDNIRDMDAKGRRISVGFDYHRTSGPNSVHSKLTLAQVKEIRKRRDTGETLRSIGSSYGVCEATICLICKGINWSRY